jgi:N-acetylneuraminic acid mutarotase
MKKSIIVIIALFYSFLGVNMHFAAAGAWTQEADFGGTSRSGAVGFSIGSKGYIGTGYDNRNARYKDFWEYDPVANTWTQKADFGGTSRSGAVGFSIGSKGYIGTGGDDVYRRDLWEYDPVANTWAQKADFGGISRYNAVGFSIGSKGYIGTGQNWNDPYDGPLYKDFWEYDPVANTWAQKADFGGTARGFAVGFSIGSKGYIGAGGNSVGSVYKDFWEYDPVANIWAQKADFGGTSRSGAVGFSIGSKGYIGTGYDCSKDFWEYDSAANMWTQKTDFEGTTRGSAVGFSIGSKGYIGTGSYTKDFWEYDPATSSSAPLYFPHVATSLPWQTEIALINTSDQTVTGTLRALRDDGQLVETKAVNLSAHGREQIIVAEKFANHTNIGYIIFDTNSTSVVGYTKFYQAGIYRAAIPAVKEVNTLDIYISHIASTADWWTGISLVNTNSAAKQLTITFNNGLSRQFILNANEHRAFDIAQEFFNNQPPPDILSAVITNASGVIGLELFGSIGGGNHLDGILLTDRTASTIYYPHVASDNVWWTGIVAYNPSTMASTITITPYSEQGAALSTSTLSIAGKGKYIGVVSGLGLPAGTAWFKIESTIPLSGFELFGTLDDNQLAAYAGSGGMGAKAGVFAKIEKSGGWTGIAFVNTEASAASVTLTAFDDNGAVVATQVLPPLNGHAKVVNFAEAIFSPQNISGATYIAYSSDRNVVGFQLNGSADGMMLDGLPGLGGTN